MEGSAKRSVANNGGGISPEEQAVILDRIRRARHRDNGRPAGSGLGSAAQRDMTSLRGD